MVRQRKRVDNVVLTDFHIKIKARLEHQKRYEQAGAELGQAQLKLKLNLTVVLVYLDLT